MRQEDLSLLAVVFISVYIDSIGCCGLFTTPYLVDFPHEVNVEFDEYRSIEPVLELWV